MMRNYLKNRWVDILLGLFLLTMLLPQTRMPIQVFIQKIIALSPNELDNDERFKLKDYNLIFENKNGEQVSLKEDKGKVIVINFWATWCPPCVAEMPDFAEVYKDYKNQVEFYFITQDDWKLVNKFEAKRKYNLPYYKLLNPSTELNYKSLPTTYVIDKSGNIIIQKVGVADWDSKDFRGLLNKSLKE